MKAMLDAALVQTEPVKRYSPEGSSSDCHLHFTPALQMPLSWCMVVPHRAPDGLRACLVS